MAINYDKYIGSTGTHYISNSGGDERGKITGGAAGDQTGGEWKLKAWYNRPWSHVLRHPDPRVRRLIAELAIEAALNDCIGYDQNQRGTFWQQLKVSGYRPANIKTKCESDCSAGANSIVKAVGYLLGITALQNVSSANSSRNTRSGLKAAGFEVLTDSKYRTGHSYLLPGDILLYENHHVATNITRGKKATGEVAGSVDTGNIDPDELRNGSTGAAVKDLQTRLIALGFSCGPDGADGDFGSNTEKAVKAYQKSKGLPQTGVYDAATRKAMTGAESATPAPATPATPATQSGKLVTISGCTVANIRSGPGKQFEDVGDCKPGNTFEVVDTTGWVPVLIDKKVRWISEKYAKAVK